MMAKPHKKNQKIKRRNRLKSVQIALVCTLAMATLGLWILISLKNTRHPIQREMLLEDVMAGPISTSTSFLESFSGHISSAGIDWNADSYPKDGPFSDNGIYFQKQGIRPPKAFRASIPFGQSDWLTAELYSRSSETEIADLFKVVSDPARSGNSVIRLASPQHTDAAIIRPTRPLPPAYKISLRVGFANFGDGLPGPNGYDRGDETSEPWSQLDATRLNGFYWLSILDAVPRPHNNIWLHHHRKVTVDSCNHYPAWMEIDNGKGWIKAGTHPIMLFALDGRKPASETIGKPFISYANGRWHPSGQIKAINSYKSNTWYTVSITRQPPEYIIEISGDFKYGGEQHYKASINYVEAGVWHHNQPGEPTPRESIDEGYFPMFGPEHPHWPADGAWPDYFMLGQPHSNFYEGEVYYDDITLEVL